MSARGSRRAKGSFGLIGRFAMLSADFLAENGRVVPRKAQFGIAGKTAQSLHQRRGAFVVVQKYVPLRVFHQSDNVDPAFHHGTPCSGRFFSLSRFPAASSLLF